MYVLQEVPINQQYFKPTRKFGLLILSSRKKFLDTGGRHNCVNGRTKTYDTVDVYKIFFIGYCGTNNFHLQSKITTR